VFERFTERARLVLVYAQEEARGLRHNYLGTEHILLGLLRDDESVATQALASFDVTIEEVRAHIARIVGQGDEVLTGQIPFTPRAKKVLELSLREAMGLGHNYIGPEHILLGIVRENDGVAARVLLEFDASADAVRSEVGGVLSRKPQSRGLPQEGGDATESFPPTAYPALSSLPPLEGRTRSYGVSIGGRPPWWHGIVERTDLWFGMLLGTVLSGVGLLVGWLIWG
jgi:ATP-dependent Clp protease ATP-binding subunit ClpC